MNLLQTRIKFRELSGMVDLVGPDGADNGATFFINEGRKYLDRLDETQKSWASVFRFVNTGNYSVSFPLCRAIKEVWVASTTERWQLDKKKLQDLLTEYLSGDPATRETGTPLYYSPTITRYVPEDATATDIESFLQWVETPSGKVHEYNSILLNIPTSEKIVVEVKGLFYSAELVADEDTNYWSIVNPSILIMAAIRATEVFNRNTQGVNDWNNSIRDEVSLLGKDLVEEEIAEVSEMEG